ncbi:Endonuclease/Exonuclease/phosphatase family protein [Posidoniimonas polymericola]|uniref:Endonuclease/Exonuclease/phosphatase family protein n=1 Tax=Posidoniimonas polymericola TaxID=2528002 RepID=A0A5C5XV73_9BACT|nr:endonuclease/exonuclease/phosphatase family protein [Posidoniimonas polymericola]TWT66780.1 Endonuclease/Exonuclease/phosphatase family protein [Posidoniimonas polymericola]
MRTAPCWTALVVLALLLLPCPASAADTAGADSVRVATYNISFYRRAAGELEEELRGGDSAQAKQIAEVIQRVRPDVILLNEVDYTADGGVVNAFRDLYLSEPQNGQQPIDYPHVFFAPVNTGEPTEFDLDRDGRTGGPADCFGYGRYPGQYGMAVLSRLPIDRQNCRTFQNLLWRDLQGAKLPVDPTTGKPFYTDEEMAQLRLSSKSHWDVPVTLPGGKSLHLICSHPTPPSFDGPEDRNGCRNYDEIRLIADYARAEPPAYLVDDAGRRGGMPGGASFVVLGDLNADPHDAGAEELYAIGQLLEHPRINADHPPTSEGAVASSKAIANLNSEQQGPAEQDTANFSGDHFTNLRVDYVLPSRDLKVVDTGVFWPLPGEPGAAAVKATDHRLVWMDMQP